MGSILNFIFPLSSKNIQQGPITNYVMNNHSYTLNLEKKEEYKNILLVEVSDGYKSLTRLLRENENILEFVKTDDVLILACSVADPCTRDELRKVYGKLKEFGILEKAFFIDSNKELDNEERMFAFHYFLEEAVNSKESFFGQKNDLGYVSEEIDKSEINEFRNKKFLSFQRNNDKPHRLSLLHDYLTNDFSDSYFSFLQKVVPYCTIYQGKENQLTSEEYNRNIPIELDTNGNIEGFRTNNTFKKDLFLNSIIHIVSETSCENNELFISEKVLKPILNFQPFILIGPHLYLNELRKLGFKTFGDFWDESYDEIKNPQDRYLKLREVILDLNKKTISELNLLYKNIKDICIYNNTKFNSMKIENSIDKIFKKL